MIGGLNGLKGLDPRKNKGASSGRPKIVYSVSGYHAGATSFTIPIDNSVIRKGDFALLHLLEAQASNTISCSPSFTRTLNWVNSSYQHQMRARRLDGTETGLTITKNGYGTAAVLVVVRDCQGISSVSTPDTGDVTWVQPPGFRAGGVAEADGVYLLVLGNISVAAAITAQPSGMTPLLDFVGYDRRVAAYAQYFRKGETIGDKSAETSAGNLYGWSGLMI